jgi:hypothetical protein
MSKQSLETKISYQEQEAYTTMDRSKVIMLLMAILPCIMYSQGKYAITIGEFPVRILVSSAESGAIEL